MNSTWIEDNDLSSDHRDRQLELLLEPTPLPHGDNDDTFLQAHMDHSKTWETWLSPPNSSEPVADHLTDDFFDDIPSWTTGMTQLNKKEVVVDKEELIRTDDDIGSCLLSTSSPPTTLTHITCIRDGKHNEDMDNASANLRSWQERYNDLVAYKQRFGNCCVPSQWPTNPPLAQWVKRQRHQLKLQREGQHSTMSEERKVALDKLGFVWDPHTAFWEERLKELEQFRKAHGHANVPTRYPQNPQLAIWAKCQRRQMKICMTKGPSRSNMTLDRMRKLNQLGFVFCPRHLKQTSKLSSSLLPLHSRNVSTKCTMKKEEQQSKILKKGDNDAVFPGQVSTIYMTS